MVGSAPRAVKRAARGPKVYSSSSGPAADEDAGSSKSVIGALSPSSRSPPRRPVYRSLIGPFGFSSQRFWPSPPFFLGGPKTRPPGPIVEGGPPGRNPPGPPGRGPPKPPPGRGPLNPPPAGRGAKPPPPPAPPGRGPLKPPGPRSSRGRASLTD